MTKHDGNALDELGVAERKVLIVVYQPDNDKHPFDVHMVEGIAAATYLSFDGRPFADDAIYDPGYPKFSLWGEALSLDAISESLPIWQEFARNLLNVDKVGE